MFTLCAQNGCYNNVREHVRRHMYLRMKTKERKQFCDFIMINDCWSVGCFQIWRKNEENDNFVVTIKCYIKHICLTCDQHKRKLLWKKAVAWQRHFVLCNTLNCLCVWCLPLSSFSFFFCLSLMTIESSFRQNIVIAKNYLSRKHKGKAANF